MEYDEELRGDALRKKAKRANRLAIISCFLLALFWPVGAFFAWIFLGSAVYFGFLTWFYRNQVQPLEPDREQGNTQKPDASTSSERSSKSPILIRFLLPIMGLVIFGVIARMIISGSAHEEKASEEMNQAVEAENSPAGEDNPNDIDVLTNRGNEFYNKGKHDSALFYYNRVLTIDPSNQFAQYDKALVYYSQKDYSRSIPILILCLYKHPDYGEAFWLLGDNYFERHHLDSAKFCFNRAYEKGIRNGALLQLMASLYEADDRSKAIGLYRESVQQDSTLLDSYRKLIELDPSQANAYQRMMSKWSHSK